MERMEGVSVSGRKRARGKSTVVWSRWEGDDSCAEEWWFVGGWRVVSEAGEVARTPEGENSASPIIAGFINQRGREEGLGWGWKRLGVCGCVRVEGNVPLDGQRCLRVGFGGDGARLVCTGGVGWVWEVHGRLRTWCA